MAFERVNANLERLNENIRSFAKSSAEYYKLDLYKMSMKGATSLVEGLVMGFLILFTIFFISMAVAVLLSVLLEIPSIGFFIVGGLYLLGFILVKAYGGPIIEKLLLSKTSKKIFNKPEENETENSVNNEL